MTHLAGLTARFNLATLGAGWHKLTLTPGMLDLPPGVALGRTTPASILVRLALAVPRRP